jgi:hypothetical protein
VTAEPAQLDPIERAIRGTFEELSREAASLRDRIN